MDLDVLFKSLICQNCSMPLDPTKCGGLQREGVCGHIYIDYYHQNPPGFSIYSEKCFLIIDKVGE